MSAPEDNLIERITANRQPHYEPFGWHHWPEHPGDKESWHTEWLRIAQRNHSRVDSEERAGHIRTAMEACSTKFISYLDPPGEAVEIPYENGVSLCAYFVRAPFPAQFPYDRHPVLICMGGLDSIKDEMWFAHGAIWSITELWGNAGENHGRADNPTIGQEILADRLADRFGRER
jgi:hypothetical protein